MDAEAGARKFGLETVTLNARNAREIDAAFEQLLGANADGIITATDPIPLDRREQIVEFANRHKLPAYGFRTAVRSGGCALELWSQHQLDVSPSRRIRRTDSEGCELRQNCLSCSRRNTNW